MTERDTLCEKAANAYRQGNYVVIAGSSPQKVAFKVLERYAGKLARTVLRGAGAGNSPSLPDGMTKQTISAAHNRRGISAAMY
jgi:fructose-1-phosphate kinase PfkB-like protein